MRCQGNPFSRRGFLAAGTFGGLGMSLPQLLWMQQAAAEQKHYDFIEAKAQSVIHVYLPGGMAHQESWDPKPYSPLEYRGEMKTVKTNTGEVFSESIPKMASIADRLCVIRSMTHGEAAHERGHPPGCLRNFDSGNQAGPCGIYSGTRSLLVGSCSRT